ncbi:hypothetical protein [Sphingomonas japonica]|uniref:Uncharacterized protein n=1 Tax=Sphingomonas japonica TaxID=511662 RepID=A0ABX0U565_9SPHN|nr:hypothetical protein [Sphingomonas japonica]NIJ24816.1 hypothetical protein [Sphingomonas japonica]
MTYPTPPETVRRVEAALRTTTDSYSQIALVYGIARKTVAAIANRIGCVREAPQKRMLPEDFGQYAPSESNDELMQRYNVAIGVVYRWRVESGISGLDRLAPRSAPKSLGLAATTMTRKELCDHFKVGDGTLRRWLAETGVKPRRPQVKKAHRPAVTRLCKNSDGSLAGRAVEECLRFYGPVHRCNADGRTNDAGTHWRRGMAVLTDADVIERAERLGWSADEWRKVAA